jgi:hypothetical protein
MMPITIFLFTPNQWLLVRLLHMAVPQGPPSRSGDRALMNACVQGAMMQASDRLRNGIELTSYQKPGRGKRAPLE